MADLRKTGIFEKVKGYKAGEKADGKLNLSSPWVKFYREIESMFGGDPEIKISFDEEKPEIKLYVDNYVKASALEQLLPSVKYFGIVTLKITIIPSNTAKSPAELYNDAFSGNPVFCYTKAVEGVFTNPITYVVFKNKVVQYFADNLGDIHGNCSTLYQDIAQNIFEDSDEQGVCYCTGKENE